MIPFIEPPRSWSCRPLWTVAVPTNGYRVELIRCLKSVLEQKDHQPIELLVLDNGLDSQRIEMTLVELLGSQWFNTVTVIRSPFPGMAENWNLLVSWSLGYWVHLLHDDDYVLPGFYSTLEKHFLPGVGVVSCGYENVTSFDKITFTQTLTQYPAVVPDMARAFAHGNPFQPPAIVIARETYEQIGGYRPDCLYCSDWELWARAAAKHPWFHDPAILARYQDKMVDTRPVGKEKKLGYRRTIEAMEGYMPPEFKDDLKYARQRYLPEDLIGSICPPADAKVNQL